MKIDREAPIGVFDSGVGGLTVAREIMRNLPSEKIVYFGDTARVPYGSKSKETIIRYSRQIIRFLQQQQVKAIVVADMPAKQSNLGKTVTDDKLSDRPAERTSLQERLAAMKARVSGTPAGRDAVDKAKGKDQIL